jgi:ankyrin repeat protein
MIEFGAAINIQSRKKETPLVIAVKHDQLEMVKFLIDSHADVQKTALGHRNPLFFANVGPVADLLVTAGTGLNHKDDDGNTPLHVAAERGLAEVAEVLIKREAQLNAVDEVRLEFGKFFMLSKSFSVRIQTPLHKAADNGHAEVVDVLLKSGAQVKVLDLSRQTPEGLARTKRHYRVLEVFAVWHETHDEAIADYRR